MTTPHHAIITGSSGSIGTALAHRFRQAGFRVCGLDRIGNPATHLDTFIEVDLNTFAQDMACRNQVFDRIRNWTAGHTIDVLVNNAAYQYVSQHHPLPPEELSKSYNVNLIAPYLLITHLADCLTPQTASVINIGSIHRQLTKPGFVAYATTKAALAALTKGLALDFGDRMRINCIEPASVETPMLLEGFKDFPERRQALEHHHPQQRISSPEEIAELAWLISSPGIRFLHGACIDMSGGISSRLHDPA